MIAPERGASAESNFRLPKQTASLYRVEKDTLTCKKNKIKILTKLYKFATSHSVCNYSSFISFNTLDISLASQLFFENQKISLH